MKPEEERELLDRTKRIETILTGNGSKGHEQRLEDLETFRDEHPRECPLIKRRIPLGQIVALCIAGASLATTWIVIVL